MANWLVLIKERFSPAVYIPTILAFTTANALFFVASLNQQFHILRFLIILVLQFLFFFRMRLFDEIKDYETDLKVNPTRPLARGLLTPNQVWRGALYIMLAELILVSFLGLAAAAIYILAMAYSLLMYREFFIGDFLRPLLTTYAVSHTFVSAMLGLSVGVAMTRVQLLDLTASQISFALHNWAFFNLFEFARKTFSKDEERIGVPSYSNVFGMHGALALSISQVGVGLVLLSYAFQGLNLNLSYILAAGGIYVLISMPFGILQNRKSAQIFRGASGVYLLIHLLLISASIWSLK